MSLTQKAQVVQSKTYRLVQPGQLVEEVIERKLKQGDVVVQPSIASICHADLRYYTGQRRKEALAAKLPMALIHEGIGIVKDSRSDRFLSGQRVVIVPNLPGYQLKGKEKEDCCPSCQAGIADNYCTDGEFLGSGYDGIAQELIIIPEGCLVPIPAHIPNEIAVLAELCSVSHHALSHVRSQLLAPHTKVAVFGDGPVGYLTAALIHHLFDLDQERLQVFGAIPEKLEQFDFARRSLVHDYDFSHPNAKADIVVECTGGRFSAGAIDQAIQLLNPGGSLILMGVTEEKVPINTRDILEKGLTFYGSSRSSTTDFEAVLQAMEHPAYQKTLRRLLPEHKEEIYSVQDFKAAMDEAAAHRAWEKTLLHFHW